MWKETGYFNNVSEAKPLVHLWSLGVEEQFYIFWPFVLLAISRWGRYRLRFMAALTVMSFFANVWLVKSDPIAAFFLPYTRFWELMCGAMLAHLLIFKKPQVVRINQIFSPSGQSALGVLLIVVALIVLDRESIFPGWLALLPTLGAMLVIVAGPHAWINRNILSQGLLVRVGLISYPLYLWHWPFLSFLHIGFRDDVTPRGFRLVVVVVSFFLAWLTWSQVEQRVRNGQNHHRKAVVLVLIMVVVGAASAAISVNHGIMTRAINQGVEKDLFAAHQPGPTHTQSCDRLFPQFENFSVCNLSQPRDPDILIVGDSHSQQYFESFATLLPSRSVMNIAAIKCLPFTSERLRRQNDCYSKIQVTLQFIQNQKSLKTVILAGYWGYNMTGQSKQAGGWRTIAPPAADQTASFLGNGRQFIEALLRRPDQKVIVIADGPALDFDIRSCFDRWPFRLWKKRRAVCAVDQNKSEADREPFDRIFQQLFKPYAPAISVFDPSPLFCDGTQCQATADGAPLFYDGDHFMPVGSERVVRALLPSL